MASIMNLDSVVSNEVECAICLERLDTPRILACLHSFCENCLEKCARSQKDDSRKVSLECALCKNYTELPKNGVRGLRLDFRATRLVEALIEKEVRERKLTNSANKCETCGYVHTSKDVAEGNPYTYCRECCQILCQRCSSVHAGLRMTQNHTVASISDLLEGKVTFQSKDHSVMCPKHTDEKLKLFCVTCLEPICHDCTLIDHSREKGHKLQFLKDFVPTIRDKLRSTREDVAAKSERFTKFLGLLDQLELHIVDHSKKTKYSIQCAVEEYKTRVDDFHHRLEREGCEYLEETNKQLVELRRKTENMKALVEKSISMTQQVLDNKQDLVGIASMYKSLLKAMDRAIAEEPDEEVLKSIKQSVGRLHFHVTPLEAQVGKVIEECSCRERKRIRISCTRGPKDLQFTRDGRLAAVVQDEYVGSKSEFVYVKSGEQEHYYRARHHDRYQSVSCHTYTSKLVQSPSSCASIKLTAMSTPGCSNFAWNRWLPTLQYDSIRCFSTLSGHRFVLATTDAKLHLLAEDLKEISGALPEKKSISGLATDGEDTIYASDGDHRRVFVLRADGSLERTIQTGDLSPTGVAVSHAKPTCIVISHEPASASVLDFSGNILSSIHNEKWKKAVVGCDAVHGVVCVLWADGDGQKTLQRFTYKGEKIDTLFEKEVHDLKDLMLAVSPSGMFSAAVVMARDVYMNQVTTICHCDM